ncbi:hypothetical protein SAMN05720606_11218 [Paenibacillus polysaccharolyticus]|uniref:Uncharacterized protein n=1 Tax=Paenibacillus polysaccharolyticus TaxID=582692 RepID=A0A1G5JVL5_9BACL|nr:hypothetical protein [Paenibacillus polysaccharolyticus]SCY91709.1 hypothetical protein SAMN05720606_11218 [Paenibacillus polysaccharolyticus]
MLYRLTFALNEEEIVTTEMTSDKEDLVGATEEAFEQIEQEYGPQAALNLVAFSLLKLEGLKGI